MSQTKVWLANSGTTTQRALDGSPTRGAGGCKRFYVGRYKPTADQLYDFKSYVNFAFDWPANGTIVSAILTLAVDDGLGILGDTMGNDPGKVAARRLTGAFSEHTSSATFASGDYTAPASTTSGGTSYNTASAGALDAVNIDITGIVETWAPTSMRKRNGAAGGNASRLGLMLFSSSDTGDNAAFISEEPEAGNAAFKPYITLTYEYGHTTPDTPTNLTPTGAVASIGSFQGDFSDPRATDTLRYSQVQVYAATKSGTAATNDTITSTAHGFSNGQTVWFTSLTGGTGLSLAVPYYVRNAAANTFKVSTTATGAVVDITVAYSALTVGRPFYDVRQSESNTAITNGRFDHIPNDLTLVRLTNYSWRARVFDQEAQVSAWTALTTFSVTNTNPNAPTLTPPDATSKSTLDGLKFSGGTFTDPDAGDTLLAYEVQLSAYPEGDSHWLDDEFILWHTGKRYRPSGSTDWSTFYGGSALTAGTYYWRARQWDNHQGVSNWAYASIVLTSDFVVEAQFSVNSIQQRPKAPWRIVIKAMGTLRGPGTTVAILEDAMNVGASIMYNSPGEAHWTLGAFHPQISVIEPKQTHYAIEFRQGDGWREVFAGLVWDFDATDSDIVFYGIDYVALYDEVVDEQYKSSNSEAAYNKGGSKYSSVAIRTIISDQLTKAARLSDSPVGFITVATVPAALSTTLTVYSTYQPVLNFITGLLDSYRAGTGKRTRFSVQKTSTGYQAVITDDPGVARDNLRLRYGELVQGFRVVPFGDKWATRVSAIGRDKDGIKVRYKSVKAPGIDESVWGRFMTPQFMDGVSDDNDLARRARQFIVAASMLGRKMGLGLRSGVLNPRDGYDLCDYFPVDIQYGSVDTTAYGHDGYWQAVGITWTAGDKGRQSTILTLLPKESGSAPSSDLLVAAPISKQAEWQLGWKAPNPLVSSSRYWLDQNTGKVYARGEGTLLFTGITGDV